MHLNYLNTKLQQTDQFANEMYDKLILWKTHIQQGNLSYFQTLKQFAKLPDKKKEYADQLQNLLNKFFARLNHEHSFAIFFPLFHTDVDKAPTDIQMELIDLQARADLKTDYMDEYWRLLSQVSQQRCLSTTKKICSIKKWHYLVQHTPVNKYFLN